MIVLLVWDDQENVAVSRPANVKLQLLWREKGSSNEWSVYPGNDGFVELDGIVDSGEILKETVAWKYTFANLPLKKDGVEVEYTVREVTGEKNAIIDNGGSLPGSEGFAYTVTYSEDRTNYPTCDNSITVTNKLVTKNFGVIKYSGIDDAKVLSGAKFTFKHKTYRITFKNIVRIQNVGNAKFNVFTFVAFIIFNVKFNTNVSKIILA